MSASVTVDNAELDYGFGDLLGQRHARPAVFRAYATDSDFGVPTGELELMGVHDQSQCEGEWCVIHNPSDHSMRDFPRLWRADRRIMERICPHGVGHPDPDDLAFLLRSGRTGEGIHGCCGCCTRSMDAAKGGH